MCYKRPGPRCSYHTGKELAAAREDLKAKRRALEENPGDPILKSAMLASQDAFFRAQIQHATTPKGKGALIKAIQEREERGESTKHHELILKYADRERAKHMRMRAALSPISVTTESRHPTIKGRKIELGAHALKQAREKMFDMATINETFQVPEEVYPNGRYKGQWRITGNGLCLVGEPSADGKTFRVITMYLDRVVTAPRQDQLQTAHGQDFAKRYAASGARAR